MKIKTGDIISSEVFENLIMCADEYFNEILDKNDLKSHKKTRRFLVNPPCRYVEGRLENDSKYTTKIDKDTKFVVTNASNEDGGSGGGLYQESYPSVYTITAKELHKNKWKDDGILIQFIEDRRDVRHSVSSKSIKYHGNMEMRFE